MGVYQEPLRGIVLVPPLGRGSQPHIILVASNDGSLTVASIIFLLFSDIISYCLFIHIPNCRYIKFDGGYAYVTSYAGPVVTNNPNYDQIGYVAKVDTATLQVMARCEVGFQPDELEIVNGRMYVANSGGIASQLPPDYSYDKTVSIIDTKTFKVTNTVEVEINLKNVYSDGAGNIYVTTLGNYWSVHSGLFMLSASNPTSPKHIGDYVSISSLCGDTVYCIGTDSEFDWSASHTYKGWSVKNGTKTEWNATIDVTTPYSLAVLNANAFLVGDAGDYFNPGSVACYNNGSKLWSVTAGVCPGHFAIW